MTKENETKRKHKIAWWLMTGTSLLILGLMIPVSEGEDTVTVGNNKVIEWTEDRLYKEEVIEYSLVDNGILEFEDELKSFVEEKASDKGVYSHTEGEHTYILISAGEDAAKEAIQLYDVRADEGHLYVGYTFFEHEQELSPTETDGVNYMLIRLDATDRIVEGRMIQEETQNLQ